MVSIFDSKLRIPYLQYTSPVIAIRFVSIYFLIEQVYLQWCLTSQLSPFVK